MKLHLRSGTPDFLDLPWERPLSGWSPACDRLERLPKGASRHPVEFVNWDGELFAFKETSPEAAESEYARLLELEELGLPAVRATGYVLAREAEGGSGFLITRYLEHSLPYSALFGAAESAYREHLLDAMAGLLVELHVAGVYWGDCSLENTLFRRDAGRLQAYLVDAETVEVWPSVSDGMRGYDLVVMSENVGGSLSDLIAAGVLGDDFPVRDTTRSISDRYAWLWEEVNREVVLASDERFRIQERIDAVTELGFSVGEMELRSTEGGDRLQLRLFVTDRSYHQNQLHALTGLEAEETQARRMVNEIHELRAALSRKQARDVPLNAAAYEWLTRYYEPVVARLQTASRPDAPAPELYCRLLEHKWYLSEARGSDVGHEAALEDFVGERAGGGAGERAGGSAGAPGPTGGEIRGPGPAVRDAGDGPG